MKRVITAIIVIFAVVWAADADILTWVGGVGPYGTAANWDSNSVPDSADIVEINNGGTATVASGAYVGDQFYMGRDNSSAGHMTMSGGSLTFGGASYIAGATGSTGSVTMAGSSALTTGNLQVGSRGGGLLDVGSAATGTNGVLYIGGAAGANGTMNLAGTWNVTKVFLGFSGATGHLNLNGGSLTLSTAATGDFDMDGGTSRLTVNGSSGYFFAGDDFLSANSAATLDFIADGAGFTTLNVTDAINIDGATLNIDLDAYSGGPTNFMLMNGASWMGTFASTNFLGSTTGTLVYDTANGDLRLQVIPEPATIGMVAFFAAALMFIRNRFAV